MIGKKERKRLEQEKAEALSVGLQPGGKIEKEQLAVAGVEGPVVEEVEIPKEGVVCG